MNQSFGVPALAGPPGEVPSQNTPIATGMLVGWGRARQPPGLKAVQSGGLEIVDQPVANQQRAGGRDATNLKLRAQVPEGVRIWFTETRGKREKAQLRLENSAAQPRGGEGGVEFA